MRPHVQVPAVVPVLECVPERLPGKLQFSQEVAGLPVPLVFDFQAVAVQPLLLQLSPERGRDVREVVHLLVVQRAVGVPRVVGHVVRLLLGVGPETQARETGRRRAPYRTAARQAVEVGVEGGVQAFDVAAQW